IEHVRIDGGRERLEPIAGQLVVVRGELTVLPQGATSDRGGAMVQAPRVFRFLRDAHGSRAELGGRTVLSLPGDGWVLGEHRSARGTWLIVTEIVPGAPDRVHILRAPP